MQHLHPFGHRRPFRRRLLAACTVAVLALLPATAAADAEVEPNDWLTQAQPPTTTGLLSGTVLWTDGDEHDYWLVNLPAYTQVSMNLSAFPTDDGDGCVRATVRTLIGDSVSLTLNNRTDSDERSEGAFTTGPAGLRGLIDVTRCPVWTRGGSYEIELTPPNALAGAPGVGPVVDFNPEPNELREQAAGPIGPNLTHVGIIDTANDADWMQFWVPPGTHQVSLQLLDDTGDATARFYREGETRSFATVNGDDHEWSESIQTITGPVKVFTEVKASGYPRRYGLRIETADPGALTVDPNVLYPPPPPPPPAPADVTAPTMTFSRAARSGTRSVRFTFTNSEPGTVETSLTSGGRTLASRTDALGRASTWSIRYRLSPSMSRKIRRANRRGRKIRLTWTASMVDAAGNRSAPLVYRIRL